VLALTANPFVVGSVLPVGALLWGLIAEAFGLQAVFFVAAAITIALLPARLVITDRAIAAAEAGVT
jgi:hypothetical protein